MTQRRVALTRRNFIIGAGSALTVTAIAHLARLPHPTQQEKQPTLEMPHPEQPWYETITADWPAKPPFGILLAEYSITAIQDIWTRLGLSWDKTATSQTGIPPVFVQTVPSGLADLRTPDRKAAFFLTMAPHIVLANHILTLQRRRLERIAKQTDLPNQSDHAFVMQLAERMRLSEASSPTAESLLPYIDVIPTSLALAQAVTESGWGTSRFAREGNAMFGVWTWSKNAGMIPEDRAEGKTHSVRAYDSIFQSVTGYMDNLNRHPAYAELRALRQAARAAGRTPGGTKLAEGLMAYSERRGVYIEELQTIMRINALAPLDDQRLDMTVPNFVS